MPPGQLAAQILLRLAADLFPEGLIKFFPVCFGAFFGYIASPPIVSASSIAHPASENLPGFVFLDAAGPACYTGSRILEKGPAAMNLATILRLSRARGAHRACGRTPAPAAEDGRLLRQLRGMQRMLRLPEMGRTSMKKTTWIVRTAVCLALLLVLQVATKSLGQFVTGSCVNLVLAMAALSGGFWSGVAVAVLSPFCAYALGIGPAFLQLVPCVALGNAVYAVLFALLVGKWLTAKPLAAWGSMVLAAVCKLAALYVVLVKLVAPMIVPAAKLTAVTAAFTWPQLVTALIGGVLACLIAPPVRRALEK